MNSTTIFLSLIFGSIGMGYLVYGKKQQRLLPLVSGLVLCAIPYFISSALILSGICILVILLPFILKL